MTTGFAKSCKLAHTAPPQMRFLSVGSWIRLRLPSHHASRRSSCHRLMVSAISATGDSHPQATRHARRTRERPGCRPVSHHIGAVSAERISVRGSVRRLGTESKPTTRVCVLVLRRNVTASARATSSGDDIQPHHRRRAQRAPDRSVDRLRGVLCAKRGSSAHGIGAAR